MYASKVIDAIFMNISMNDLTQYVPTILNLLLRCLQDTMKNTRVGAAAKTGGVRRFFHTLCVYSSTFGGKALIDGGLENIERGLIGNLVGQVIEPQAANFVNQCSGLELRRMLVGGSRMLTESEAVGGNQQVWGKLASAMLTIAIASDKKSIGAAGAVGTTAITMMEGGNEAEDRVFDSTYSRLTNSVIPGPNPTPEMQMGAALFIKSLQGLCQSRPGVYLPVLQGVLSPEQGQALQELLQKQGVQLV